MSRATRPTTLFARQWTSPQANRSPSARLGAGTEFPLFLRLTDKEVPKGPDMQLPLDNEVRHKHSVVKRRLAERRRDHLNFTPRYSWWLSEVECWFGLLSEKALKRDRHCSSGDFGG